MTNMSISVGPTDVLLGRGGQTNNNTGNRRFRTIVMDHQAEYLEARKKDKAAIARKIVAIVHSNGGRFLQRDGGSNNWVEVPLERARLKTSQALREGLDVRNKTTRPSKLARRFSGHKLSPADNDGKKHFIPGWVVSSAPKMPSPAVVSLSGDYVPELQEEYRPEQTPLEKTLSQLPSEPISKADVENVCEV